MREVTVTEAVGMVLCHDITEIIPGREKRRAFQNGHVIRSEDIPRLSGTWEKSTFMSGSLNRT